MTLTALMLHNDRSPVGPTRSSLPLTRPSASSHRGMNASTTHASLGRSLRPLVALSWCQSKFRFQTWRAYQFMPPQIKTGNVSSGIKQVVNLHRSQSRDLAMRLTRPKATCMTA